MSFIFEGCWKCSCCVTHTTQKQYRPWLLLGRQQNTLIRAQLVKFGFTFHQEIRERIFFSCHCRKELDVTIRDTQSEVQQVSQVLAAYESIGMGFDSLVEEYTKLRDEVENKTWAVRELKHSLEKD